MTTKRRSTMSMLALVAGLVGMVAFLAGPASADHHGDGLTSGGAYAEGGSVASGSAVAINDSTASGDAVAIDGSVASGCSTAVHDSTASGADCHRDTPKAHHDGDQDAKVVHHDAAPARATSGAALALTGSSSDAMVQMALVAFFAGLALVSLTNVFRRQTV
ncbi:MAG TPA: hypothetical protein VM942_03425 [Acidimicrobiales bacterium]|nr:hypothetical protein [Acidimicrobiales bacterium]